MTRGDYTSSYLSAQEANRLFEAAVFAFCIGRPLTRFISIHLDAGGVIDRRRFISKFNKLAGDWLRNNLGSSISSIWVLEKPVGGEHSYSRGFNVHILVHVPYHLQEAFYRKERGWIKAAGAKWVRGVCKSKQLDGCGPDWPGGYYLREGLLGVMRYITKGIEPASAGLYGIKAQPQGVVAGKRSGYSEALGEKHRWKNQIRRIGRLSILMPCVDSRRRRFVALNCPELLGLPPLDEGDLCWA
jgi:hypothetical protein